jgi:hypothetical protein
LRKSKDQRGPNPLRTQETSGRNRVRHECAGYGELVGMGIENIICGGKRI